MKRFSVVVDEDDDLVVDVVDSDWDDGVEFRFDGKYLISTWFKYGVRHRVGGPTVLDYYDDGSVEVEKWWENGKYIR